MQKKEIKRSKPNNRNSAKHNNSSNTKNIKKFPRN